MNTHGRRSASILLVLFLASASVAGQRADVGRANLWIDVYQGEPVPYHEVLEDLATVRAIYLGERHTLQRHHELQVQILNDLAQKGLPLALGLEQMEATQQSHLDRYNRGEIDFERLAEVTAWPDRWQNYKQYRPILEAARKWKAPIIALNARSETIRQVARSGGIEHLAPEARKELPAKMQLQDPPYEKLLSLQMMVHASATPQALRPMIEAQIARDEAMAQALAACLKSEQGRGRKVLVLCGAGHVAYGLGLPTRVGQHLPDIQERIVLFSESGEVRLSAEEKAQARAIEITHEQLRELRRPVADYLCVKPLEEKPAHRSAEAAPTAAADKAAWKAFTDGRFSWNASGPLVTPDGNAADPAISIKDPTVVCDRGRWHMFCTVRLASGKVDIEYLSFADWKDADKAPRHRLNLHDQYYCAPQVFYFRPQKRWYLVYQIADKEHIPPFGPACSTTTALDDPQSWSKPRWLYPEGTEKRKGLDFWIICDETKAHLFDTSNDGRMWRAETRLADFPGGWSPPVVALQGDIFEASHTYRLKGVAKYLTIVEAQADARRYYKAYLADRLEGPWLGSADSREKPFAALSNVAQDKAWTTNISHGELLRTGTDERMEVDPADLRFLFQGASDAEYRGNPYGKIPWRLGILEAAR